MTNGTPLLPPEADLVEDPLEVEISRYTVIALKPFLGKPMNDRAIERIEDVARAVRTSFLLRGIDSPVLVPVVLRSAGEVRLFRADLNKVGVENVIRALTAMLRRTHPGVPDDQIAIEIARGVMRAWPWYRGKKS